MEVVYLLEFLIFSFFGWIIDSGYRTIMENKLINAGYFKGPICPIYGAGGLLLVFLTKNLLFLHWGYLLLVSAISVILVELFGGIFSEKVLKLRLWDYSNLRYNFLGHISLLHSFYWTMLVILFYFLVFPYVLVFESITLPLIPEYVNLPVIVIFIATSLWLVMRKSPEQFLEFKGRVLNMSVTEYQRFFSAIKKVSRVKSVTRKEVILSRIMPQVQLAGATLRLGKIKGLSDSVVKKIKSKFKR